MEKTKMELVKNQESFNLVITEELEKKIRFLCDKLPKNEWSGTLFYSIEGSFKDGDLIITAKDFFLQDVGESTYTEFQNDADLAGYIATHELWDCNIGLCHSHQDFSAFFSGTDLATLREEGTDNNHFLSLIVNNAGKYCAAITRRVCLSTKGNRTISYNSFDNEAVEEDSVDFEDSDEYVEYYNLNIIMPVSAPKSELELRLEEVKKSSKSFINRKNITGSIFPATDSYKDTKWDYKDNWKDSSYPYLYKKETSNLIKPPEENKQLSLFSESEMEGGVSKKINLDEVFEDIPYGTVRIDNKILRSSIMQIVTGDIFAAYKTNIELDKWVPNMKRLYDKRFGSHESDNFKYWVDNLIDFLAEDVEDANFEEYGDDFTWAIWAYDLTEKLESYFENYPENEYIKVFIKSLNRWII